MPADPVREAAARAILRGLGHQDTATEPTLRSCFAVASDQRITTPRVGEVLDALQAAGYTIAPPGAVVVQQNGAGAYSIGSTVWPGLAKTVEEAGELLQVLGKLIASRGHAQHWDGTDLHVRAVEEIGDLHAALSFLAKMNSLPDTAITERADQKYERFLRWQIEHSAATPAPESDGAR